MKTLYLDTATTGRFNFKDKTAPQPHLLRVALRLTDGDDFCNTTILIALPDPGWDFEAGAVATHGIDRTSALLRGVDPQDLVHAFIALAEKADRIVAYSVDFHIRMIRLSAEQLGIPFIEIPRAWQCCAMHGCTKIVAKPREAPGGGFAFPKMTEAYRHFTGTTLQRDMADPVKDAHAVLAAIEAIDRGTLAALRGVAA